MAEYIKTEMQQFPDYRLIALMGNIHAMYESILGDGVETVVSQFPREKTYSINVRAIAGSAWTCGSDGKCGPDTISRGLTTETCQTICFVEHKKRKRFDGEVIMREFHASPPAVLGDKFN